MFANHKMVKLEDFYNLLHVIPVKTGISATYAGGMTILGGIDVMLKARDIYMFF